MEDSARSSAGGEADGDAEQPCDGGVRGVLNEGCGHACKTVGEGGDTGGEGIARVIKEAGKKVGKERTRWQGWIRLIGGEKRFQLCLQNSK